MVTMPVDTPVAMPVVLPTVAIAVLLLLHVPPDTASVSVVEMPVHVVAGPVIAAGALLMVTSVVAIQFVLAAVYVMVDVPVPTPLTTPVDVIVATDVLLLDHDRPGLGSVSVNDVPIHEGPPLPSIVAGAALIVTEAVR